MVALMFDLIWLVGEPPISTRMVTQIALLSVAWHNGYELGGHMLVERGV